MKLTMMTVLVVLATVALTSCTKKEETPVWTATGTITVTGTATSTNTDLCDCIVNPVTKELNECECGKNENSPPPVSRPVNVKVPATCPKLDAGCPAKGAYQMIDMATYGDQKFYDGMACSGIKTIGRYYDWPGQETIKGKIPSDAEVVIINDMGFERLHVFQHNNSSLSTFTPARGKIDAEKALGLAKKWKQPKGSAIYFGVDGDFTPEKPLTYFGAATPIIRAAGYRVGMYGSGGNCEALKKAGLVDGDLCWIAASSWGWRGTKAILAKGKGFALKQKVNQKCLGRSLDYNTAMISDYGQWRAQ